jgi:hypothetical protein
MSRILAAFSAGILMALQCSGAAVAQTGCQPTITQPCARPAAKPADQSSRRKTTTDDTSEPTDHSPRIRLDRDTDVKFGTGGIGLGRKF